MNGWARRILVVVGCTLVTVLLLLVVTMLLQRLPLPNATSLADAYWQRTSGVGMGAITAQFGLVWHMLAHMWLLWLVPLCGVLLMIALMGQQEEMAEVTVFLERIHLLEQALKEARDKADMYGERWGLLNNRLDELFENSAEAWLVVDRAKGIRRWNKTALELARRTMPGLEGLEGQAVRNVIPAVGQTELGQAVEDCGANGKVFNGEVHAQALQQWLLAWIFPMGEEVAVVLRDISHRYRDDAFIRSTEKLARQLVEDSVRPVAVLDASWRYIYVSRKWPEILGLGPAQGLIGRDHREAVPDFPSNMRVVEQQIAGGQMVGRDDERRTLNGRELLLSWHIRPWLDAFGRLGGYIFTVVDQTETIRLRQQVMQAAERENALAYSDALTGLPNRQLFHDRLNMALAQAYRQLGKVALFFLDLDGFKAVNDQLGHDYGDLLLKQVAERLKTCVRTTDTVARLGGDEFTIILSIRDRDDAQKVAQKVLETIRAPYDLNGKVADKVGTSIGIALYPQDGSQAADLMRKADNAMYGAKQGGKNAYRFATTEIKVQG